MQPGPYHESTTQVFVYIYDSMRGDEIEGWVYRLAHFPFDDAPQMTMDARSKFIRKNRAD